MNKNLLWAYLHLCGVLTRIALLQHTECIVVTYHVFFQNEWRHSTPMCITCIAPIQQCASCQVLTAAQVTAGDSLSKHPGEQGDVQFTAPQHSLFLPTLFEVHKVTLHVRYRTAVKWVALLCNDMQWHPVVLDEIWYNAACLHFITPHCNASPCSLLGLPLLKR